MEEDGGGWRRTKKRAIAARDAGNETWNDPEKKQISDLAAFIRGSPGSLPRSLLNTCNKMGMCSLWIREFGSKRM